MVSDASSHLSSPTINSRPGAFGAGALGPRGSSDLAETGGRQEDASPPPAPSSPKAPGVLQVFWEFGVRDVLGEGAETSQGSEWECRCLPSETLPGTCQQRPVGGVTRRLQSAQHSGLRSVSVAGVLVGHPFDTVKVRLQVQSLEKPQYRGTLHCFQSIIKQESVLGLYKGLGSPLMGLTFINALVFGVQGGLRGVNRGMVSTLLRETPSFGVYFLTYDVVTRALGCEPGDSLLVPKLLLAGGTSGILSWLSTYPNGILDCMRQSYRAEGWRVFTRGLTSTLLRAFPVNAATFATVTIVLTYARGPEDQSEDEGVPAASGPALAQPSSL
ncbi:PREDICTED: mitochondrial basic amino acids transporter [Myotis davidii]|uniref:mitochondrial basic amino acids transporter n=1 Tax=Myotis davidii TaxID=225400 RepID=UPI0007674BBA|nr:PREDICTED: mitochondrial basic amino acids transporter [Myotis davidii]